jgi:hypothetical protein
MWFRAVSAGISMVRHTALNSRNFRRMALRAMAV